MLALRLTTSACVRVSALETTTAGANVLSGAALDGHLKSSIRLLYASTRAAFKSCLVSNLDKMFSLLLRYEVLDLDDAAAGRAGVRGG
eukprot:COSAG02_NODE_23723_length_710_cov_0.900164_2_plen_88_part_00